MLYFILGIFVGICLTLLGLLGAVYYFLLIIGRLTEKPGPRSPFVISNNIPIESNNHKLNKEFSSTRKTWVKLLPKDTKESKNEEVKWSFVVLKANMFFIFKNEEAEVCNAVFCLDGCEIDVALKKFKKNTPVWTTSNYIILSNATRDLLFGSNSMNIYFKTGKDLEEWYYALQKASAVKALAPEQKSQQEYWDKLSTILTNTSVDENPDWVVAIGSRIFYSFYNSENFINLILKKIRRKISEITKPSYVSDISVRHISVGPTLPIIKTVRLLSLSNEGAVQADAEFTYAGGFNITIEVTFKLSLPGSRIIFIPAVLTVVIQKASGKVHLHIDAPPAQCLWIGFYEEPEVKLDIKTEIGENYKIKQIPKLANIIVNKIKQEIIERMVLPNMDDIPLPKISNPLRATPAPFKKTESEPILNDLTKNIALTEEPPNHKQLMENIDKQFADYVEAETKKNKKN